MRLHRIALGAVVASTLALTGCGATKDNATTDSSAGSGGAAKPATGLQYMVPNAPGGGYDTTARAAAQVMEKEGITGPVQVFNLPGAGGTVGLQRVVNEEGNGQLAMQMGLGVLGAAYTQKSKASLNETTPIAKLIEEAGAIVVPKDSPYTDIKGLVAAWKADPAKVTIGGGSSPGGPDHLFPMELAKAVGVDPKSVNFVTYDGGGDLLTALLGKKITVGTSSPGELIDQIEAGQLRVLAVSSDERVEGVDAPTLKESGIDMTFANWRGVLAPPGISDEARKSMIRVLEDLHGTQGWKDALVKNGWTDAFVTGEAFEQFLVDQDNRVSTTLTELGLL